MPLNETILKQFDKKNVLVTGGTGMIGRQVVDILVEAGASVKIVSLDNINVNKKAVHEKGDLTSFDYCKKICEGMDFVFHVAGVGASIQASIT